jgi:geranylgeranylglycerol-phosphate geranylgeranyltransferase
MFWKILGAILLFFLAIPTFLFLLVSFGVISAAWALGKPLEVVIIAPIFYGVVLILEIAGGVWLLLKAIKEPRKEPSSKRIEKPNKAMGSKTQKIEEEAASLEKLTKKRRKNSLVGCMQKIMDWWSLARAEHAVMVAFGVLVGELLLLKTFGLYTAVENLLVPIAGPVLITLATFIFNDYSDYESDKALKRMDRPLVSKRIRRSSALLASVLLFPIGVLASSYAGETCFEIALAFAFFGWLYSAVLKKLPLLGNLFVAGTMAVPFVYGNYAIANSPVFNSLVIAGIAFSAGLGRELFQTLRDVKGDRRIGAWTLPMVLGAKNTVRLSALFMDAAIALSVIALYFQSPMAPVKLILFGLLLLASDASFAAVVSKILKSQNQGVLKECRNLSLQALALGLAAFLVLSVL